MLPNALCDAITTFSIYVGYDIVHLATVSISSSPSSGVSRGDSRVIGILRKSIALARLNRRVPSPSSLLHVVRDML